MNPALAAAILQWATPIVLQIIRDRRKTQTGEVTDEEILATFNQNIEKYLNEGAEWRAQHPDA